MNWVWGPRDLIIGGVILAVLVATPFLPDRYIFPLCTLVGAIVIAGPIYVKITSALSRPQSQSEG